MQVDLHEFLSRLTGTVVMTLAPVVFIAFLSLPSSLHHHFGSDLIEPNAPVAHMT